MKTVIGWAVFETLPLFFYVLQIVLLPGTREATFFLTSSGCIFEFLAELLRKVDREECVPSLHLTALAKQSKYNNRLEKLLCVWAKDIYPL